MSSADTPAPVPSLSLLAWGYNEEALVEDFLRKSVRDLERVGHDWEIVLVDDGSTDRTAEIAEEFARTEPRVRVVRHGENLDVGWATRTAVSEARNDVLFWNTVDSFWDTETLPTFLAHLPHADVVQGVRVQHRSDNLRKNLVSRFNKFLVRLLFGLRLTDYQNVTFYRRELAQAFELEARSSVVNPECLLRAHWQGAHIREVPMEFTPRPEGGGAGKGTRLPSLMRSLRDVWTLWFRWKVLRRFPHVRRGRVERWWEVPDVPGVTAGAAETVDEASPAATAAGAEAEAGGAQSSAGR